MDSILLTIIKEAELFFHKYRWRNAVVCPYCGSLKIYTCKDRYKCGDCKNKFTDKTGTIFQHSKVSLSKWFLAIYLIISNKGISSIRLAREIGVSQKTAWLMLQKIRFAFNVDDTMLTGIVAQDEMYIGGSWSNFHYGRKLALMRKYELLEEDERDYDKETLYRAVSMTKFPVFGMNDGNKIVLKSVPNPVLSENLMQVLDKHNGGIKLCVSDESKLYDDWKVSITKMNHSKNKYKFCGVSSNAIEGTFSHFKRNNVSNYVHQSEQYLQLYLNEFCFRWNHRNSKLEDSFNDAFKMMVDKTVTAKIIKEYNPFISFRTKLTPREIFELDYKEKICKNHSFISSVTIKHQTFCKGKDW